MRTLVINSSNYVGANQYTYTLPQTVKFDAKDQIGVASLSIYNNTFNITAARGNNTLTFIWNAATPVTYNWTIPDGYYAVSTDLNYWLQQQMILNNLYVTNSSGQNVYFMEFATNAPRYAVSINAYALPTSATATTLGYTKPAGSTWSYPAAAAACPQITLTASFAKLLGFSAGSLPPNATTSSNVQYLSTTTPNVNPIDSYILTCSLLSSPYSIPSDVFFTIPLNGGIGSLLTVNPSQIVFNNIAPNQYKYITIKLFDQLFNPLSLNDFELTLTLAIQEAEKK